MIDFKQIIGHEKPIQILKNRIKFNRIGHSYLFSGKGGIGKKLIAIAFSKAINCINLSQEQDSCNHCSSCLKIEKNISPDFRIISSEGSGLTIKIDQIRELKRNIYLKPLENRKKLYIIDNADRMTTEASNALLKILEEPPEFAILILITSFPEAILPTILSRCCRLSFKPLKIEQQREIVTRYLTLAKDELENIIRLSSGSPGKALSIAGNQQKMALKNRFLDSMVKIRPEELIDCIFYPDKAFPDIKDYLQEYLEMMILWFRDILFLKMGMDINQLFFQEQINTIREYAYQYTEKRIIFILEYLVSIPEELEKHISPNTLLENIFIQLGDK
jgi:DNA polymerase III subunit delta'